MAVGSMSPNWASVVHHGTNEVTIQHQSVPALIQKRTAYPEPLGCFTSKLIYVTRQGKSPIQGDPQRFDFSVHQISSPRNLRGRGGRERLVVKSTAALFPTLFTILHSLSHISSSDKWVSIYLTRSTGCLNVATRAVSSAHWAISMWREGVGMSFTYKLKSIGEITPPPCATPARMRWYKSAGV